MAVVTSFPALHPSCRIFHTPGRRGTGNNMKRLHRLMRMVPVLLLILPLLIPPVQAADGIDWKEGALAHLAPYIGTYEYDAVLDDATVQTALRDLVGEKLPIFRRNLSVSGPIDFSSGNLVLSGLAPHQGGAEEAMILIKIYDGTVRAGLLHQSKMTLYARDPQYAYIPKILRDFLAPRPPRASLPPQVEWIRE